jgi:hypothetical protein
MHAEYWCGNVFENEYLEDREGDAKITSLFSGKWIELV